MFTEDLHTAESSRVLILTITFPVTSPPSTATKTFTSPTVSPVTYMVCSNPIMTSEGEKIKSTIYIHIICPVLPQAVLYVPLGLGT